MILYWCRCTDGNFQTHPIHVYGFSEKYTYACIIHINLLPINVCYVLMIESDSNIKFIIFHPETNISEYI